MNITTSIIAGYAKKIADGYHNNPNLINIAKKEYEERIRIEDESIKSKSSMCPVEDRKNYRKSIPSTNESMIKSDMGEQFYNFNVMLAASCAVTGIFFTLPLGNLTKQEAVNEYISNPKRIGKESAYGYAISAGIKDQSSMMVIKTSRKESVRDLEHELFVALNGTNKMREGKDPIPNFAIVYGGSRCSKSIIDPKTKEIVSWCSSSVLGNTSYTIYENIIPSVAASDYTKVANTMQVMSMFLQVLLATQIGYEKIGWTHYDYIMIMY